MYAFLISGALVSILFTKFTGIVIPFTIQQALSCAPFLLIGMRLKLNNVFDYCINNQLLFFTSLSCAIFSPTVNVAMRVNSLTPFSYLTSSIISIILIFFLAKFQSIKSSIPICISNFFSWLGRYSLVILALHSVDDEIQLLSLSRKYWPAEVLLRCSLTVILTWILIKFEHVRKLFCLK